MLDSQNRILEFKEGHPLKHSSPWVNAGAYVVSPKVVKKISKSQASDFGNDVFPVLLHEKHLLKAYPIEGCCLAIDTPKAYQRAQKIFQRAKMILP